MSATGDLDSAAELEHSCAVVAVAVSDDRRDGVRIVTGDSRSFGLDATRRFVHVPFPSLRADWTLRSVTCGVALQCSPSKERIAESGLRELSPRERRSLSMVEGGVAADWIGERLPGLLPEIHRAIPELSILDSGLEGWEMLERARQWARDHPRVAAHPLLGVLPLGAPGGNAVTAAVRRMYGRMPWTTPRTDAYRAMSVPVGGEGGVRNPNEPPPSRPENEDIAIDPDHRVGIPYPEWNMWTQSYLRDHVAVLERALAPPRHAAAAVSPEIRRWFEHRTHRGMRGGLEDGSDLDIDRYTSYHVDTLTGPASAARVFRDLAPHSRDVVTAVLLDGSSSLSAHGGRVFRLELACADALSRAMSATRQAHAIFVFTGNTRHRVEVLCLKNFDERGHIDPSAAGLGTGGYTRLGAPLRHLTARLLGQRAERRQLLVLGDGLISDEGYEGRYAWADAAQAVQEATEAGVSVYYLGVGPVRVDPLPTVFGEPRSRRLRRIEDLPRALAEVHRELVS
ncbi:MorD protein [Nocardia sp. NPDC005745]|uniref:nitric oxide reductase activation protein NorD n=1 Tax=Nocardia sp. NPDC005745 TaxID=3157061 RepID=UPI0033F0764E